MMKMIHIISNINTKDEQNQVFENVEYIYTDFIDKIFWLFIKQRDKEEFAFEFNTKRDVFIVK